MEFTYNHARMVELLRPLIDWYIKALDTGGYPLIALLMAVESSIVPLPSEVVIPPAAHLAHTEGKFSMVGIVIAGTIGSWLGATVMYWVSRLAGRPLVMRFGKYVFISPQKVVGAERWAARFGAFGIFAARLLPVVRHLIGIPAGIVRMDFKVYSLYTVVGSGIWCAVLCWLGVKMGQDEQLMKGEMHRITLWVVGILAVLGAMYYFLVHRYMKDSRGETPDGPGSISPR
jgi:membrane protein DedA with SNARE-associated domain